ncbi:hypothetical protein [Roseobacter sp. S98]|uniref:hypothetical protein n=1 Tax=Roseobacter algicola (ex Choi et al. 2025) (nom. illeg.) TaxID=3092138 RepID=UPI003893D2B4
MGTPGDMAEELRDRARQNFGNAMHATHVEEDVDAMMRGAAMIDHLRKVIQRLEGTTAEEAKRREAYRYGPET